MTTAHILPASPTESSTARWITGLGVPAVGAITVALTTAAALPTLCPFRLCTGHACPGCGLTRGVSAAVRGDFGLSIRYHPMAILVAVQLAALWMTFLIAGPQRWRKLAPTAGVLAVVNMVALTVLWVVRWRLGLLEFVLQ